MNKNLTEKIYNDMTTLLKEKNLISSIPSLTIVEKFKEVDCQAYIVTHEVNGIEKYDIYVNDASYDDIVKNLKVNKEKSINDLFALVDDNEYLVLLKYPYSSKILVGPADDTAVAVIVILPVTFGIAIFPFE